MCHPQLLPACVFNSSARHPVAVVESEIDWVLIEFCTAPDDASLSLNTNGHAVTKANTELNTGSSSRTGRWWHHSPASNNPAQCHVVVRCSLAWWAKHERCRLGLSTKASHHLRVKVLRTGTVTRSLGLRLVPDSCSGAVQHSVFIHRENWILMKHRFLAVRLRFRCVCVVLCFCRFLSFSVFLHICAIVLQFCHLSCHRIRCWMLCGLAPGYFCVPRPHSLSHRPVYA